MPKSVQGSDVSGLHRLRCKDVLYPVYTGYFVKRAVSVLHLRCQTYTLSGLDRLRCQTYTVSGLHRLLFVKRAVSVLHLRCQTYTVSGLHRLRCKDVL